VATATLSKLRLRVESLQKENEDVKAQCSKINMDLRSSGSDTGRVQHYEQNLRDLQMKMARKDEELDSTQAMFMKSQQVNDCLNTLLALETEQKGIFEERNPVQDDGMARELDAKKSKASHVINRLNQIMQDDESASRPTMQGQDGC